MSKYSSWEIAFAILANNKTPIHYKKLSELVIKTGLSDLGKNAETPYATLNRVMTSDHSELFKKVSRGTYEVNYSKVREYHSTIKNVLNDIKVGYNLSDFPIDINEPPERIESTIYRVLRDTKITRELKEIYKNECQICGDFLKIGKDKYYSEAHHIIPLGGNHKGLDKKDNILILCPKHHVLLDYGVVKIVRKDLLILHDIKDEYIEYHNKKIFNYLNSVL